MKRMAVIGKQNKSKLLIAIGLIIAGLFSPEPTLQAFDSSNTRQQGVTSREIHFFEKSIDHLSDPSSQGIFANTNQENSLRISGIDPGDNGLGEEVTPVGNGIYILLSLSMLFIGYRFRQERKKIN